MNSLWTPATPSSGSFRQFTIRDRSAINDQVALLLKRNRYDATTDTLRFTEAEKASAKRKADFCL